MNKHKPTNKYYTEVVQRMKLNQFRNNPKVEVL